MRFLVYVSAPRKALRGEIVVNKVISGDPDTVWKLTKTAAGIDAHTFRDYFAGSDAAHALRISETRDYEVPMTLDELRSLPGGFSPPQFLAWLSPARAMRLSEFGAYGIGARHPACSLRPS